MVRLFLGAASLAAAIAFAPTPASAQNHGRANDAAAHTRVYDQQGAYRGQVASPSQNTTCSGGLSGSLLGAIAGGLLGGTVGGRQHDRPAGMIGPAGTLAGRSPDRDC